HVALDMNNLPNDVESLKKLIKNQQIEIENKTLLIEKFRREAYARKSEKLTPEERQQALEFNEIENQAEITIDENNLNACSLENLTTVKSYSRKKGGRKPIPAEFPRTIIEHDLTDAEKQCSCGHEMSRIGEETSEQLDIIP